MNLILFREDEIGHPLPLEDLRAIHIIGTLKRSPGDLFDIGIINGPRGKARIRDIGEMELALDYTLGQLPPPLHPLILIVGLPRPQSARQILRDATTLGVEELCFTITEKGEKSYAASRLWSGKEYEKHLIAGAQQAFSTRIPRVRLFDSLAGCLESLPSDTERIALDNYEAKGPLSGYSFSPAPCALAVGSERGWARGERQLLIKHGFTLAALGEQVLRTETACTAGIILVLAGKGLI